MSVEGQLEIVKSFGFDAAHTLSGQPEGHRYGRVHGHSFYVDVSVSGTRDAEKGWVSDFANLDQAVSVLKEQLDHNFLNEIDGLEQPTLENIAHWIAERLKPDFPGLSKVVVRRPSFNEACHLTL